MAEYRRSLRIDDILTDEQLERVWKGGGYAVAREDTDGINTRYNAFQRSRNPAWKDCRHSAGAWGDFFTVQVDAIRKGV